MLTYIEKEKAKALKIAVENIFKGYVVEYQFADSLHKFRLNWTGPTHWLYVGRNFVDDHTEQELFSSLTHWNIQSVLLGAQTSRWLRLDENGVHDVDDAFGRGLP